jgi:hypothetical protein
MFLHLTILKNRVVWLDIIFVRGRRDVLTNTKVAILFTLISIVFVIGLRLLRVKKRVIFQYKKNGYTVRWGDILTIIISSTICWAVLGGQWEATFEPLLAASVGLAVCFLNLSLILSRAKKFPHFFSYPISKFAYPLFTLALFFYIQVKLEILLNTTFSIEHANFENTKFFLSGLITIMLVGIIFWAITFWELIASGEKVNWKQIKTFASTSYRQLTTKLKEIIFPSSKASKSKKKPKIIKLSLVRIYFVISYIFVGGLVSSLLVLFIVRNIEYPNYFGRLVKAIALDVDFNSSNICDKNRLPESLRKAPSIFTTSSKEKIIFAISLSDEKYDYKIQEYKCFRTIIHY